MTLAPSPAAAAQLATFWVDGSLHGVPVSAVQEVLRLPRVTRVPLAPPAVAGLMNLRGAVVTVLELRERLGLPRRAAGADAVVLVLRLDGGTVGLVVDAVADVLDVDPAGPEALPDTLEGPARELLTGAYALPGQLLLALDVERAAAV